MHAMTRLSCLLLSLLLLGGCAGFRGGRESIAYVGDTPSVLSGERPMQTPLEFGRPGLRFSVDIDNRLRTQVISPETPRPSAGSLRCADIRQPAAAAAAAADPLHAAALG